MLDPYERAERDGAAAFAGERAVAAFGAALRAARQERQLSQKTLGIRADTWDDHVSMLERGERMPSLQTLARLACGLDCAIIVHPDGRVTVEAKER